MVFRSISFWTAPRPEEVDEFEAYYRDVHVPLAVRVPGVLKLNLTLAEPGPEGRSAGIYRVAEVLFEDMKAYRAATETPEWTELGRNVEYMLQRFDLSLTGGLGGVVEVPLSPDGPVRMFPGTSDSGRVTSDKKLESTSAGVRTARRQDIEGR